MNSKHSDKVFRIMLSVIIIPTFVFMCAAACHCPTAQASPDELIITKAPSCCCPNGDVCTDKPTTINKDEAANVQAFEVEKLASAFQSVSSNLKGIFSSRSSAGIFQFSEVSPPNISHLATVQLLI